ncbi:hypothetical protein NP233_g7777 [Leucocoprinus birnbaumii]|uniref:Protein kinase domain-containing protein n=1 Tax=Leucocoprinus birnbaumii TaxID=56174 RepID=A0AAD5VU21_9AGAR|nr:hypothetical protein NP233_g7777 [Leucocoprinus birnbaumii]
MGMDRSALISRTPGLYQTAAKDPHIREERGLDDSKVYEEDKYGAVARSQGAYTPPGARIDTVGAHPPPLTAGSTSAKPDVPKVSVNGPEGHSVYPHDLDDYPDGKNDGFKNEYGTKLQCAPIPEISPKVGYESIIERCWDDVPRDFRRSEDPGDSMSPESRVIYALHSITEVLDSIPKYKKFLSVTEKEAEILLDLLQKLLDSDKVLDNARKPIVSAMMRLCKVSGTYPRCLALKNVQFRATPLVSGSYGDIYQGKLGVYTVSLKANRVFSRSQHDIKHFIASYAKEAVVWSQLKHPNLLPFYGIYRLDESHGSGRIALVSPWMDNGNISEYLINKPDTARFPLTLDTLEGLSYLHMHSIIHGDLKGANILITPEGSACLADFGLSSVDDPDILRWRSLSTVSSTGGTTRWQAPELMNDETPLLPTLKCDIYSMGSVIYEILVGKVPYHEYTNNASVMRQVIIGRLPTKPSPTLLATLELTEDIWEIMGHWLEYRSRGTSDHRGRRQTMLSRGGSSVSDVKLLTPYSQDLREKLDGYDLEISDVELELLKRLDTV